MQSQAQELRSKTLAFWNMSQVWNGRKEAEIQTGEAIELCTIIIDTTNYSRPLSHCADTLLQEIIKGEGCKASKTKILPFTKPIKKKARSNQ